MNEICWPDVHERNAHRELGCTGYHPWQAFLDITFAHPYGVPSSLGGIKSAFVCGTDVLLLCAHDYK